MRLNRSLGITNTTLLLLDYYIKYYYTTTKFEFIVSVLMLYILYHHSKISKNMYNLNNKGWGLDFKVFVYSKRLTLKFKLWNHACFFSSPKRKRKNLDNLFHKFFLNLIK